MRKVQVSSDHLKVNPHIAGVYHSDEAFLHPGHKLCRKGNTVSETAIGCKYSLILTRNLQALHSLSRDACC